MKIIQPRLFFHNFIKYFEATSCIHTVLSVTRTNIYVQEVVTMFTVEKLV